MTLARFILRSLRRSSTTAAAQSLSHNIINQPLQSQTRIPAFLIPSRSFAFSSAEEAAAERRRRKRRLRIEPPLHALQRDPNAPRPRRDPNQPDTTSALVGPRLSLHNRVQSLIRAGDLDNASLVSRQAVFSSTRPTVFTCNAIIGSMYRAKRYSDAVALFQYFFRQSNIVPNVVSYNFLIVSHCENGEVDKGLELYEYIKENAPFGPSSVTFRHLTKGLIDAGRIDEAVDLLWKMIRDAHGADSLVFNNIISGFLDLDNLEKANEYFDELKSKCTVYDGVVNATFMDWFFKKGRAKEAMESYKSLLDKNYKMPYATCNVLLEVLLKWERTAEAEALFDTMLDNHTPPVTQAVSSDTFNIMVNECFKKGKMSEAMDVFRKAGKAPKSRPFSMDTVGYNNIITRYCEHEMMEDAEKMFVELCGKSVTPDVNTYRTLIDAYFKVGRVDDALEKYVKMVDAGLRVITTYANKWFSELIEKGKVADCATILTKMCERDPKPDPTTYDIVIRALCEVGNYDTAADLFGQMVTYGVGILPALKEFALETFDKIGRKEEIDKLLNARWPGYGANLSQNRNAQQHGSGPPYGNCQQIGRMPLGNAPAYGNSLQQDSRNHYGNGQQHNHGNYYGNQPQHNNGNLYGNELQHSDRNYYGIVPHQSNGNYYGNGQQHYSGSYGDVLEFNNGNHYGSQQQQTSGNHSNLRLQYQNRLHHGNGQWQDNRNHSGNVQQYESKLQHRFGYGEVQQHGNAEQYGNGLQHGIGQQPNANSEQYRYEPLQHTEEQGGDEQPRVGSAAA